MFLICISSSKAFSQIDYTKALEKYRIPNYYAIESYRKYVNHVLTYVPIENEHNKKMIKMLGESPQQFIIEKIKRGKIQKNLKVIRTDWYIRKYIKSIGGVGELIEIQVYSGDMNALEASYKDLWEDEARIYDLPLYNFYDYEMSLSKVEKPENSEVQYGEISSITDSISKYQYEDNIIDILLYTSSSGISFYLKNKTQHSLKILWDDASFVDIDGTTSKIIHKGIKYINREESQPPTTIIRGATLDDVAIPTRYIFYYEPLNMWITDMNLPKVPISGMQVTLMLPIQVKGITNEYFFVFDASNMSFRKSVDL